MFGGLAGGGGSIARASLHANASLIGLNGTFPDVSRHLRPPACLPACLVGRQLPSLPCRCTHRVGTSPLPQLDMLPMGQIRCQGAATVQHPACNCDNW